MVHNLPAGYKNSRPPCSSYHTGTRVSYIHNSDKGIRLSAHNASTTALLWFGSGMILNMGSLGGDRGDSRRPHNYEPLRMAPQS